MPWHFTEAERAEYERLFANGTRDIMPSFTADIRTRAFTQFNLAYDYLVGTMGLTAQEANSALNECQFSRHNTATLPRLDEVHYDSVSHVWVMVLK